MIVKNEGDRSIECTVCGERIELSRKTMSDPELKMILVQELTADHQGCERFADQPYRAKRRRQFAERQRAEAALRISFRGV